MCGIALVLSGARITGVDPYRESSAPHVEEEVYEPVLSVDDFKAVLQRRGPDNLGWRKLFLHSKPINSLEKDDEEEGKKQDLCSFFGETTNGRILSAVEGASTQDSSANRMKSMGELYLLGSTLQLRGISPVFQPLEDLSGNLLVYNGEIFGGIDVADDSNDAESLLHLLERCCSCDCHGNEITCSSIGYGSKSVPEVLSTIKGPWALIYWQEKSKTLWFGRDAYGRRSLLVHWPTFEDSRLVLSSVSPPFFVRKSSDSTLINEVEPHVLSEAEDTECTLYWEELPCGIYSIHLKTSNINEKNVNKKLVGEVRKHEWSDPLLQKIIGWDRVSLDPKVEEVSGHGLSPPKGQPVSFSSFTNERMPCNKVCTHPAQKVLIALRESVNRRAFINKIHQAALLQNKAMESAPIALLFSGGLDSMILAALLDQCLDPKHTIDLLNVSFDSHLAPDRVSARKGVQELQRIAPFRRWRLVEIDAHLSNLTWETKYVMSLIHPTKTYMDLNIGLALWLAAGGDGWVDGDLCDNIQEGRGRYKYKSTSRILLVGSGADEQCAGYGRHRTKYRLGGWVALQEEMKIDMQRIWKRNLGRDDRCISDQGKEARFPFLDEDLVRTLLDIPLWEIADLSEPIGTGDKKILREVARLLGLSAAAILPKRAIQFGSRGERI